MFKTPVLRLFLVTTLVTTLGACASEPAGPNAPTPGSYVASLAHSGGAAAGAIVFTSEENGRTTDWISAGASITLNLLADGLTTGMIEMPGLNDEGEEEAGAVWRADLTGSWRRVGSDVRLAHQADTFLRDLVFHASGTRLVADQRIGTVRVRVVLERQ